jgi:dipeptidyl aminopeptidase/acylaminoacyl peptidase
MTPRASFLALTLFVALAIGTATAASKSHATSLYRAGIYSIRDDGADGREIALPEPPVESLIRSPGGRLILFAQNVDGGSALFAAERSGASSVRLTPPGIHPDLDFDGGAAFAPDGRTVAFTTLSCTGWSCRDYALYVVGREGNDLHLVANGGRQPSWSPDGVRFVYTGMRGIYVQNVRTGRTTFLGKGEHPTWAPRGERIAYQVVAQANDPYGDACFVNADRSRRRCTRGHFLTGLLWSPDAKRVAFQSSPPKLGVMDANAGRVRYLGNHGDECPVAWSPTGRRIAISYGCSGTHFALDILAVERPRRALRVIDYSDTGLRDFRWRGRRISYVAILRDS